MEEIKETKKQNKKEGLPSFDELRKIDLSEYLKKRDNADYLNWAVVKQLLHDNGAKKVYFEPVQQANGSSLIMCDKEFVDSKENVNRVYETRIKVVIDDLEFEMQGPVMNGANPVKDNSMSQQRLWNSQTRLFVKGVAIHTGLGFDLWSRIEAKEDEDNVEEDLSKHSIMKIADRVKEKLTAKMQKGLTFEEVAEKLTMSSDELKAYLSYYSILNKLEKEIDKLD
jgi:hypothetical protein